MDQARSFSFQSKKGACVESTRVSRVARAGVFEKLIKGNQTSDAARRKQETEYLGRKARKDGTPLRLTKDKVSTVASFILKLYREMPGLGGGVGPPGKRLQMRP